MTAQLSESEPSQQPQTGPDTPDLGAHTLNPLRSSKRPKARPVDPQRHQGPVAVPGAPTAENPLLPGSGERKRVVRKAKRRDDFSLEMLKNRVTAEQVRPLAGPNGWWPGRPPLSLKPVNAPAPLLKRLDPDADDMLFRTPTDFMDRKTAFAKLIAEIAPHLSAEYQATLAQRFAAATDPDKPMKWEQKPEGEDFETFIRREYKDRGLIDSGLCAADVSEYDPWFYGQYKSYLRAGKVPLDCQFVKAGVVPAVVRREVRAERLGM